MLINFIIYIILLKIFQKYIRMLNRTVFPDRVLMFLQMIIIKLSFYENIYYCIIDVCTYLFEI